MRFDRSLRQIQLSSHDGFLIKIVLQKVVFLIPMIRLNFFLHAQPSFQLIEFSLLSFLRFQLHFELQIKVKFVTVFR